MLNLILVSSVLFMLAGIVSVVIGEKALAATLMLISYVAISTYFLSIIIELLKQILKILQERNKNESKNEC